MIFNNDPEVASIFAKRTSSRVYDFHKFIVLSCLRCKPYGIHEMMSGNGAMAKLLLMH